MDTLWQDLRYGIRMLFKNSGFTVVAVITLALGIGANTAIFSVVYGVLLRPLPYPEADRLMVANVSVPDYRDLKASSQAFDETAIWASNLYNLSGDGEPEQMLGAVVSPSFFILLGQAAVGRTFRPEEDTEPLTVLSDDLWQRRYAGDPSVLGKTINLSNRSHTIIGVMPPEFQFPGSDFKLWVTFGSALGQAPAQMENRQLRIFRCLARLKSGVSRSQAQAEVAAISKRLQQEHPATNAGFQIQFTPLYERIVGQVRPALLVLLATVGFVLLIACVNVANLMLARTASRDREMAVRAALGASRWRMARQLLTESVVLATAGGLLGLLLAQWVIDVLPTLNPSSIPRLSTVALDVPVLLFTLGVSVLTGMLFGVTPALQASRCDLNQSLKEGGHGSGGSRHARYLRSSLVVSEIALSLVVLVGAGLLIKSFTRLLQTDAGFVADNLLTMHVGFSHYDNPQRRATLARDVLTHIERIPGVQAVGAGTGMPPTTGQRVTRFAIAGQPDSERQDTSGYFIAVSPDYFRALGTPLLLGRPFNERDVEGAPNVVIINQSIARRWFPNENPIGKQLKLINPEYSDEWRTIVGVVGDVTYSGLDSPGQHVVYTPFSQTPFFWVYVLVRTTSSPTNLVAMIRNAISSADPNLQVAAVQTMEQVVSQSVAQPRFNMLLISAFAVLALVLAAVGIYGVISYGVTQRIHELGIRMALGARPRDVLKLVVGQGMTLTLIGIVIGLAAAFGLTHLMKNLLFGVSATDPLTFASIALLLVGAAFIACYVPARRATRVDPMVALRYE